MNPLFSILASAWITGCFSAFFELAGAVLAPADASHVLACFATYFSYVLALLFMLKGTGRFGWWVAPFYPLPLFFFGAVTACSLVRSYVIRRIEWKGREILTVRRRK